VHTIQKINKFVIGSDNRPLTFLFCIYLKMVHLKSYNEYYQRRKKRTAQLAARRKFFHWILYSLLLFAILYIIVDVQFNSTSNITSEQSLEYTL